MHIPKQIPKLLTSVLTAITVTAWLLGGALVADAQGRGGNQGRGQQPDRGQPAASQPRHGGQPSAGQQGQGGGTRDRDRIHLTDQQRDLFQQSSGAADQVRSRARDMTKSASGAGSDIAGLRQQRDRLHDQVQTMMRHHEELMNGFGAADRERLLDRTRKLDQARDRMHTCLGNLDGMLGPGNFDRDRFRRETREMDNAAKQWQKQVRKLGKDLGVG